MLHAERCQHIGIALVEPGKRSYAVGRKKFIFIEQVGQDSPQLFLIDDGQQTAFAMPVGLHASKIFGQVLAVLDEPIHSSLKRRHAVQQF